MNFWTACRKIGMPKECWICGQRFEDLAWRKKSTVPKARKPTIDHIVPLSLDGTHSASNLAWAHYECNQLKGDRWTPVM